jgi:hypothetical protein
VTNFNIVHRAFFEDPPGRLKRLDAEYADRVLEGLERNMRSRLSGNNLVELCEKYGGPVVNDALHTEEHEVKYIAIDSIDTDDGCVFPETLLYKDRPSRAKYIAQTSDIVVSNVRPNRGAVALMAARHAGHLVSSGFTLVRVKDSHPITAAYVFAFLRTEFARNQLIRRNRGSMYPAVLSDDVGAIFVPTPPQKLEDQVVSLIAKAAEQHEEFSKLADALDAQISDLMSTIAEPPPSPLEGNPAGLTIAIRSAKEFSTDGGYERFDAEFFRAEYANFEAAISSRSKTCLLGELYDARAGRAPGKPTDEIYFIKQAALTGAGINWSAVQLVPGSPTPLRGRVKAADLLMACTAHEIYYVARRVDFVRHIPAEIATNNVAVADLIILRPKAKPPASLPGSFVAAFLRSPWGLHQVQRCIRGLRGGHVYPHDVEKFVRIPVPADSWLNSFESVSERMELAKRKGAQFVADAEHCVSDWIAAAIKDHPAGNVRKSQPQS